MKIARPTYYARSTVGKLKKKGVKKGIPNIHP